MNSQHSKISTVDNSQNNKLWVIALSLALLVAGSVSTLLFFVGAAAAIFWFLQNKTEFYLSKESLIVIVPFALFWLVIVLSPILHENSAKGWTIVGSNLQLIILPVIYASLRLSKSLNVMDLFNRSIKIGIIIATLTAIVQRLGFGILPEGAMGNALVFTTIMVVATFCSLTYTSNENRFWRNITRLAIASCICALALVLSKTALLAASALFVVYMIYLRSKMHVSLSSIFLKVGGVQVFIAIGLSIAGLRGGLVEQRLVVPIQRLVDNGFTAKGIIDPVRLKLYKYGWQDFKENPLLGVGLQNTVTNVTRRIEIDGAKNIKALTHLHSEYLNQLVGSGLIGLFALLLFLFAPFVLALRSVRDASYYDRVYFSVALSGGFAICNLTNLLSGHDILLTFYCFATVVLMTACDKARQSAQPS